MSTATFTPAVCRFAWKEYRVLRGLWIAVAVMAIAEQCVSAWFTAPGTDLPAWLFASSLFAAALYAVGAAAILFSVEHEDETYNFLAGLPVTWLPAFVGKLLVAALSALLLAAVLLAASGWFDHGGRWPSPVVAGQLTAIFGLGIFEAIAWGTFFSLRVKRPLIAALLALVVGTISTQLIASEVARSSIASSDPAAYQRAVPFRLAIVFLLMIANAFIARRWLTIGASARTSRSAISELLVQGGLNEAVRRLTKLTAGPLQMLADHTIVPKSSRFTLLARLLWQTWRDSRTMLLLPILGSAVVLFGVALIGFWSPNFYRLVGVSISICSLPAFYGALAFGADQRRHQFRFLAEHAASPRYVWLARHVIWFGAMIALCCLLAFAMTVATGYMLHRAAQGYVAYQPWGNPLRTWDYEYYGYQANPFHGEPLFSVVGAASLAMFAVLAAYALGQLCSMFIRSEIFAAFVAIVLSVLLSSWASLLFAWQLSAWQFLVPIIVGCMFATWLRVPDWLAERNTWRSWWKPSTVVAAPLLFAALYLPSARLAQIPDPSTNNSDVHLTEQAKDVINSLPPIQKARFHAVEEAIFDQDFVAAGDTPEARQTADMYLRAVEAYDAPKYQDDPLAKWAVPAYINDHGAIDESRIPNDELKEFVAARKKSLELDDQAREAALAEFLAATKRPNCRFQFDPSMVPPAGPFHFAAQYTKENHRLTDPKFQRIARFIASQSGYGIFRGDGIDRFMPLLRACADLGSRQPTYIYMRQLELERNILAGINYWATETHPSQDELRDALAKLTAHFDALPEPAESLLADRANIRNVILDQEPPIMFAFPPVDLEHYLAFLANRLPWERQRALRALDLITRANLCDTIVLENYLAGHADVQYASSWLREWIQSERGNRPIPDRWTFTERAAATSYLAHFEYEDRVRLDEFYGQLCDIETCRRATLLTITLASYRQEHGDYPGSLSDLVPEFFKTPPLDPYSNQFFQYEPHGLDLPLQASRVRLVSAPTSVPAITVGPDLVPPQTPLLWSVGPDDARLTRQVRSYTVLNVDTPNEEPKETQETVYVLRNRGNWPNSEQVFPLAK
jgi:hypothetical protein